MTKHLHISRQTEKPVVDVAHDAQCCVRTHPQLVWKKIAAYTSCQSIQAMLAQCDIGCIITKTVLIS